MEGAFYLWTQAEIEEVLSASPKAAELVKRLYYVKPEGNCDLSPRRRDPSLRPLPWLCRKLWYGYRLERKKKKGSRTYGVM